MGMAYEQALSIIGRGGQRLLNLDDGVLAAGDDQAIGIVRGRRKEGDCAQPFLALGNDGGLEGWWFLGGPSPKS